MGARGDNFRVQLLPLHNIVRNHIIVAKVQQNKRGTQPTNTYIVHQETPIKPFLAAHLLLPKGFQTVFRLSESADILEEALSQVASQFF